jgi:hypothetical protein
MVYSPAGNTFSPATKVNGIFILMADLVCPINDVETTPSVANITNMVLLIVFFILPPIFWASGISKAFRHHSRHAGFHIPDRSVLWGWRSRPLVEPSPAG